MSDLIGKLVRWERDGQWFTARVTTDQTGLPRSFAGEVVDPGNFIGAARYSPYFVEEPLSVGQQMPRLLRELITVVDEQSAGGGSGVQ